MSTAAFAVTEDSVMSTKAIGGPAAFTGAVAAEILASPGSASCALTVDIVVELAG